VIRILKICGWCGVSSDRTHSTSANQDIWWPKNDFPENQMTKFHAEFSNFMHKVITIRNFAIKHT